MPSEKASHGADDGSSTQLGSRSDDATWLDRRFADHRPHLRAVAYRMLGSLDEADDALQETWLRLRHTDADHIDNVGGWLTTVTARTCLNMLRTRTRRREDPLEHHVPDPILGVGGHSPEHAIVLADSVSLALLVVLNSLGPAERLAFVLHDLFDVPYDDVAIMLDRSPAAARQLASRARRRVRVAPQPAPDHTRSEHRRVVDAFFAATHDGDLTALAAVLDPDAVLRIDAGSSRPAASVALRGAPAVAAQTVRGLASALNQPDIVLRPIDINGAPGVIATKRGRPISIIGFSFNGDLITEIDAIADPMRVAALTRGLRPDGPDVGE